jgi:L-asparaginase II
MEDPIVVDVTRGPMVESQHRGAAIVMDADGRTVLSFGDVDRPIYPRSAIKGLQALALVETGAADRLGLTDAELAITCASHNGEERHTATAAAMLAKAGQGPGTLECGAHWPSLLGETAYKLAASGARPSALHNNCSGKHVGFVCLACGTGTDPRGYIARDHAVQRMIAATLGEVTGAAIDEAAPCGTDGCSIPTYGFSLRALALGFARFGTGHGLGPERTKAASRLRGAVASNPFMVAGTGRFDTAVMELLGAKVFTKTGAEGVFCAAFPDQGLGIALKCRDGAGRAAEVMMATLIARFVPLDETQRAALARFTAPVLTNWNGLAVGGLRAAAPLAA